MLVLEVEEPVFTVLCIDPGALVRAIDLRLALCKAHILLVGTKGTATAEFYLPAVLHATGGAEDVVVAVALVELGALDGGLVLVSVIYDTRGSDHLGAVGRHGCNKEDRFHAGTRTGTTMRKVGLAVLVPKGAAVNHSLALLHPDDGLPRACGVLCLGHEEALVGVTAIDVEPTVVITNGRCPYVVAVLYLLAPVEVGAFEFRENGIVVGQGMSDDLPVHQVGAMEDLQAREAGERRGGHVVVVAHTADVGVGIVGIDHRILVHAVLQIGVPGVRRSLGQCCCHAACNNQGGGR